jgi:hypothetical protein
MVCIFYFQLYFDFILVRSFSFPVARQPQELVITMHPSIPEVDLATDDILFNSITTETQLCRQRDGKPWSGVKGKSEILMKLFIHGFTHNLAFIMFVLPNLLIIEP